MILNEIGSPVGFEFKKILYESQEMKIDVYPDSISFSTNITVGNAMFGLMWIGKYLGYPLCY